MNMADPKPTTKTTGTSDTFARAGALPRVPLPRLADTASRFIAWCSPVLSAAEKEETQKALDNFIQTDGLGEQLHATLVSLNDAAETRSWLDPFWRSHYLGRRDPIAMSSNFFFLFHHNETTRQQRAASLIAAALNYKLVLDQEKIPVSREHGKPLDMSQLKYLFSATRIPGDPVDRFKSFYSDEKPGPSNARHVVVFCRNHIYRLDVIGKSGIPHTLANIEASIEAIIDDCLFPQPVARAVGYLTGIRRPDWAYIRKHLKHASSKNRDNLELIETALFAINLEDLEPADDLAACQQLLHGNGGNRWFDKTLQLIVFKNGAAGINVEHSMLDGMIVLNFVDYIVGVNPGDLDKHSGAADQGAARFEKLVFDLEPEMQKTIIRAADTFDEMKARNVSRVFDFTDFGADHVKELSLSPDAFVQCAMLLAHFRTTGSFNASSETIATHHYQHGRTETMRTVSTELVAFVKTMLDGSKGAEEKVTALRRAAGMHISRTKACQQGQAPEPHLWELLHIYMRNPEKFRTDLFHRLFSSSLSPRDIDEALTFYKCPGWLRLQRNGLCTASATSRNILYYGFGATGPEGCSIGYQVRTDKIDAFIATTRGQGEITKFIGNWEIALRELANLLAHNPEL